MLKPMPFQENDIVRALAEPSYGVGNFSTVGVGKTLIGTEMVRRLDAKRSLIIAPPNTFDGWERHYQIQMDAKVQRCGSKNAETKQSFVDFMDGKPGHFFMGWEYGRRMGFTSKQAVDMLIADESHRAQNHKSASATMLHGISKATLEKDGRVLALSGTPAGNDLTGLWSTAHALWPERYPHYWPWCKRFFREDWNAWADIPEYTVELQPGSVMAHLPHFVRHEQGVRCCAFHPRGVQEDLPKRVWHNAVVDLSSKQRKLYREMDNTMKAWCEGHDWPISSKGLPMLQYTRLLQIALAEPTPAQDMRMKWDKDLKMKTLQQHDFVEYPLDCVSSKIDAMLDILKDIDSSEPVVVWTHSAAIIPALVHRINKQFGDIVATRWDGTVSHSNRQIIKDGFGFGGCRIIVAQVASLAEGVDGLQRVCANEIWFSESANNMENIQALGRLERTGQTRAVNSWRIIAKDTHEVEKAERLQDNGSALIASLHA